LPDLFSKSRCVFDCINAEENMINYLILILDIQSSAGNVNS